MTKTFEESFLKALAASKSNRTSRSKAFGSSLPSQAEYERRELTYAQNQLRNLDKESLADRKEAQRSWFEAMQNPRLVAERIDWLLEGNYGYGAMMLAKQALAGRGRTNHEAQLSTLIAGFEWQTPSRMAIEAWKKLSAAEKKALSAAIAKVIQEHKAQS